ncbi:hypothetical protein [Streptomyces sp. NPDC051214]|uniref:hypothetical protein n=1 Tax=Streptomyces sp. NPDC051214 TaxID=3155282 RepID=UPI0034383B0C
MTFGSIEALSTLAHRHLPSDVAERWVSLFRPGVRLEAAAGADPVVGRLGGLPHLPSGWLIRPADLAERRFDRAMFTWQCS